MSTLEALEGYSWRLAHASTGHCGVDVYCTQQEWDALKHQLPGQYVAKTDMVVYVYVITGRKNP